MAAWLTRPEQKSSNPSSKFLEWSSNDKCFKFYDKEKGENVLVPLPLKFVILEHYHTVKGWHDASESAIYSNEVYGIGVESMEVKAFKGGTLDKGLYKNIKQKVKACGGNYHRSIYAVDKNLEIINLSFKGTAVAAYSEFIKKFGDYNFDKNWIEITEAKEDKKGSVKYSIPVFKSSTPIKDSSKIIPFAETLQSYMIQYVEYQGRPASETDKYHAPEVEESDDEDAPF